MGWSGQPADQPGTGPAQRVRVFDTPLVTGLNGLACVIGSLSLVVSLLLYILTFLPGDVGIGSAEFAPFFAFIFPLWFGMFYVLGSRGAIRRRRRRFDVSGGLQSQLAMLRLIPRSAYGVLPISFVCAILGFGSAFGSLAGQPEYHSTGHHFFLNNHGDLIEVSQSAYLHDLALQSRLFLGATLFFTSIATMVAWGEWSRRRQLRKDETARWEGYGRWPQPKTPRPRFVGRNGSLLAVFLLGGGGLGIGGGLIFARLDGYFANAKLLPDNGSVRLSLPPGHFVVFLRCPDSGCPVVSNAVLQVRRSNGTDVQVKRDPSSDRLPEQDQTYEGTFSLDVPRQGTYVFTVRAAPGLRLLIDQSNGEEAMALIPWIGLTAVALALFIFGAFNLVRWFRWRYRIGESFGTTMPNVFVQPETS